MLIFKIQVALRLRWYRHHVWAKFHLFQWEEHIFVVNRWVGIPVLFVPSSATIVDACALELSVALCEHPNVDILFGACTNHIPEAATTWAYAIGRGFIGWHFCSDSNEHEMGND